MMNSMPPRFLALLLGALVTAGGFAGEGDSNESLSAQEQAWQRLRALAGHWHGTGTGKPGTSTIDRTYELILEGRFVLIRNVSRFEPDGNGDRGETHEDLGVFSFDRNRKKVVLRQFHTEGFVNRYVLESVADNDERMTFVTEAVENGPRGLRARLTLHITDDASLRERFELAWPNKDYEVCVQISLSR